MRFTTKLASQVKNAKKSCTGSSQSLRRRTGSPQPPHAHNPAGHQAHNKIGTEPSDRLYAGRRKQGGQYRPSQPVRHHHAEVSSGPDVTDSDHPTQLVPQIVTERFRWKLHVHRFWREFNTVTALCDAPPKFVIVRVQIEQRLEPADLSQPLARGGQVEPMANFNPSRERAISAEGANDAEAATASRAAPNEGASRARYSAVTAPTRGSASSAATSRK